MCVCVFKKILDLRCACQQIFRGLSSVIILKTLPFWELKIHYLHTQIKKLLLYLNYSDKEKSNFNGFSVFYLEDREIKKRKIENSRTITNQIKTKLGHSINVKCTGIRFQQ